MGKVKDLAMAEPVDAEEIAAEPEGADEDAALGEAQDGPVTQGACPYCGEQLFTPKCATQEEADAAAGRLCDCKEATKARKKAEKEARAAEDDEENRDDKIAAAQEKLDNMLGGADITKANLEYLKAGVPMVYDKETKMIVTMPTEHITVKMFRMAKGNISIERKDIATEKAEV